MMETESNANVAGVLSRGAVCVECLVALTEDAAVLDRCGAALCRTCAAEFYIACAGCGGLMPSDEALRRVEAEAARCAECFGGDVLTDGEELPSEDELAALIAEYVALHDEAKRLDARMSEIKEQLKLAARVRPRVSNAVVLRASDDDAGPTVRCSFSVRTTYDADGLARAEHLLGAQQFAELFERKVSFSPVKESLEAFFSSSDGERAAAREAIRSAEQRTETTTLNVVSQKKRRE